MVKEQADDEEFEVEKIVGRKTEEGRVMYMVKWRGYSESENTWEPIEHMEGSMDMVHEYDLANPTKVAKKCSPMQPQKKPKHVKEQSLEVEDWNEIADSDSKARSARKPVRKPRLTLGGFPTDTVKTVIRQFREDGKIKFEVSWNDRDGIAPGNSVVDLAEFEEKQPKKLIDFLVQKLKEREGK